MVLISAHRTTVSHGNSKSLLVLTTCAVYHLHELPVPEDGNCTATKAHLDPYKRGEDPICDKSQPNTCQVGDLSGKHGDIPTLPGFSANYTDDFVSLIPGTPAFMGDKSFVLHFPNKTRIACANFKRVPKNGDSGYYGAPAGNGTIIGDGSGGSGSGSNSSASMSHMTHIPTATGSPSSTGIPSRPTITAPPDEGSAKAMTVPSRHAMVIGPLVFAVALAVW